MLVEDEGYRPAMYYCTEGKPTVGIGHNLERPLSDKAIAQIFDDDFREAERAAEAIFGDDWDEYPEHVRLAVVNMVFQMGEPRFRGFEKAISLIKERLFVEASHEALDSKWARQTPKRARRVSMMLRGEDTYGK